MRYETTMRRERIFKGLMWRGEEAKMEKCENEKKDVTRKSPRERRSTPRRPAADVNVMDETMSVRWLSRGRVVERSEARHLMYVIVI